MSTEAATSRLQVVPVQTKAQQRQFINFAWEIYKNEPNWVPPLILNQREMLNYKQHPFYEEAEIQTFLAQRDGKVVGRIAAIVNRGHNVRYGDRLGFFGFYEAIDDQVVANALFETARNWLGERGMTTIRGPVNPSLNHELGLLIDSFDQAPYFMMSYNMPYYATQLENCGLKKSQDMYAFWGHVDMLKALDPKVQRIIDASKERFGITVRALDRKKFAEDVELFFDIYNRSLVATWGFVPYTKNEMRHMAASLKQLIVPELTLYAEIDGKTVGVCFALLDYNPRIKAINGKLFPFGFIKLLWNRKAIKNMRIISANVVPEYQRWGVGLVLLDGLMPLVRDWGIQEAEFSWVLETNHLSRGSLEKGGAKLSKTYRIYDGEV